jgi:hypothetical protein
MARAAGVAQYGEIVDDFNRLGTVEPPQDALIVQLWDPSSTSKSQF